MVRPLLALLGAVVGLAPGAGPSCTRSLRQSLGAVQAQVKRLGAQLERIQRRRAAVEARMRRVSQELAALRTGLAGLRGQLAANPSPGEAGGRAPRPAPPRPQACSEGVLDAVRGLRTGVKRAAVDKALAGIAVSRERSALLTGSGTVPLETVKGPCFQILIAAGKLERVEIRGEVVTGKRRSRRRRTRRRSRR